MLSDKELQGRKPDHGGIELNDRSGVPSMVLRVLELLTTKLTINLAETHVKGNFADNSILDLNNAHLPRLIINFEHPRPWPLTQAPVTHRGE